MPGQVIPLPPSYGVPPTNLSLRSRGRRAGGAPSLALFLAAALASFAIAGVVIAARHAPGRTQPRASEVAPQLDRIQPGATEREVRQAFGAPVAVRTDFGGGERCLFYENLPSNQPLYRFCFEGGKLEGIPAQ